MLKRQIQYPDTGSYDPKVQKTMFQTSRLQEIMKVPQVTVIDEVAKVPRITQRQVLTIREMGEGSEARGGADQFQGVR